MINLNDSRYDEKDIKIFNGGEAGVVKNCAVRVERRQDGDKENMPLYKIVFTDETKAEINDGLFNNFDNMSDKALDFFVKKMKHLAKVFRVDLPKEVANYDELLDATMRGCKKSEKNIRVNLAVCYGTKARPQRYLEVDGFWGLQNAEDAVPVLSKNALVLRPVADDEETGDGEKSDPMDTSGEREASW